MSKQEHDEQSAYNRGINYDKGWFNEGFRVIKELNFNKISMLDLGCGNGEFSELIQKNFCADITCLDYADQHLQRVKKLGFNTIKCNFDIDTEVEEFKVKYQKKFDIVVCFEVIEHIFDVDLLLSTIHNVLKENGFVIISTPNIAYIGFRLYSLFRGNVPVCEGHHIRFFNKKRLTQFLVLNGFDHIKDYSFGQGSYYLDRTVGERSNNLRSLFIKCLFKILLFCFRGSANKWSNILFVAQKIDVNPIGVDPTFRFKRYNDLTGYEQKKVIQRLLPLRKQYFFDEHPGLRNFIDVENNRLYKANEEKNE
jgi:2-polyprenyl-3-methyl-5-hydroxy-6-metoxy-1,4-benzoquinol methylase